MAKNFTVQPSGSVQGPADYMVNRFPALRAEVEAGRSVVFNMGLQRSPSWQIALEVTLETDYNSWRHTAELARSL